MNLDHLGSLSERRQDMWFMIRLGGLGERFRQRWMLAENRTDQTMR